MFDNPGSKIMKYAKIVTVLGIIGSLIGAISTWAAASQMYRGGGGLVFAGILVLIFGCVGAYLGGLFVYGFGQLIEDTQTTAHYMKTRKD